PRFLLLHSSLGRGPAPNPPPAAAQLPQPLLQLLAVVVAGRLLDLGADLLDAALDVGLLAGPIDDGGVVLVDNDALGAAEVVERDVLELDAELLGDHLAAGENGDVLEHRLAAVTATGLLHRAAVHLSAD